MHLNSTLAARGVNPFPWTLPPQLQHKHRVAVFGSFYGGYQLLNELLNPPLSHLVTVTGVASDDPTQAFTHADVRLWKYPHTQTEEDAVAWMAFAYDLPYYQGRVNTPDFESMFVEDWRPDLCLMATFGQKIPRHIFAVPKLGFYNFHHSDEVWPSYPGPDPIRDMQRDGKTHVVITMHEVNEVLDGGRFVARSHRVPLVKGADGAAMHRITWPQMGGFIQQCVRHVLRMKDKADSSQAGCCFAA